MAKKDYYELLGVSKTATDAEIKSAFRKKAKEYHPDVNKDPGAADKFKEINEAYEVLKDPNKRKQYDQFGSAAFENNGAGGFGGFGGFGNGNFSGGFGNFGFDDFDLGSIFDSFMGGSSSGRRKSSPSATKGEDVLVKLNLTFEEAVFGCEKTFKINIKENCPKCNGKGGLNPHTCSRCNGKGRIVQEQRTILGVIQTQTVCPSCHGSGEEFESVCSSCRGAGKLKTDKNITLRVPSGIETGDQMRMSGKASSGTNGGPNVDVYIEFTVKNHPLFKRDGKDIYLVVPLTITEATLGCEKEIPTLEGTTKVKFPSGTQNNEQIKLKGKGVNDEKVGKLEDMYIITNVIIPTKLDRNQKALFAELDNTTLTNEDAFKNFNKYL